MRLEEEERRHQVEKEIAGAEVVEVDNPQAGGRGQHVLRGEVSVDGPIAVRGLAVVLQYPARAVQGLAQQGSLGVVQDAGRQRVAPQRCGPGESLRVPGTAPRAGLRAQFLASTCSRAMVEPRFLKSSAPACGCRTAPRRWNPAFGAGDPFLQVDLAGPAETVEQETNSRPSTVGSTWGTMIPRAPAASRNAISAWISASLRRPGRCSRTAKSVLPGTAGGRRSFRGA